MPHVNYLYDFQPLPCSPNNDSIDQGIDNAVRFVGTNRNSFCLLLSDAARYMMAIKVRSILALYRFITCEYDYFEFIGLRSL